MRTSTQRRYRRHRATNVVYGGELLKSRLGRSTARPLSSQHKMHIVLRATRARKELSFRHPKNYERVKKILKKFAEKHGVVLVNFAIHLNHLHLYVKLVSSVGYKRFIRAMTSAIAAAVAGARREWKFWDRRPFSRIVKGAAEEDVMNDYVEINKLEALGFSRDHARFHHAWEKGKRLDRLRRTR